MPRHDASSKRGTTKPLLRENQTQKRRERAQEVRSSRRHGVLLAKRRKQDPSLSAPSATVSGGGGTGAVAGTGLDGSQQWSHEELDAAVKGVRESSLGKVLPFLTDLRRLLSLEDSPVEEVVEKARLTPRLIQLLGAAGANDEIQIEAAWCLTNIASSHTRHTEHIVGAAPQLISFLSTPNPALQEQALWALGNIAGDSANFREMLHANGALLPIFRLLQNPPSVEIARTSAWSISNLARGDKTPASPFLPVANEVIAALQGAAPGAPRDEQLRIEAAWILAFLTAKDDDTVTRLVRSGMIPALVQALVDSQGEDPLCTPTLRTLGNMVSGLQEWSDAVMAQGSFLQTLDAILKNQDTPHRALVKEAAWVASNVAAGRPEHRDALVAQGSAATLTALLVSGQLDMQREAAFAIWNLVSHGGDRLAEAVQNPEVVDAFVGLLSVPAPSMVRCALSFLQLVCERIPGGPRLVEKHGGLEAIDDVHYSGQADPDLSAAAAAIVDRFFGEDYEDGSDHEPERNDVGGGYSSAFGTPSDETPSTQQPQQELNTAGMGRGSHLTRPAWMSNT